MKSFKTLLLMSLAFPLASEAQTASDQNEGSRIDFNSETHSGTFSWFGHNARTYFILKSDDLSTWTYAPIIESGLGQAITWNFSSTQSKFFARLRHTDIPMPDPRTFDIDGDSVGNQDELNQDTDPFASLDLDLNQIPDDWELYWKGVVAVFYPDLKGTLNWGEVYSHDLFVKNDTASSANFAVTLNAPAAHGYQWEDSLTGTAVYSWTDISSTGTELTTISNDDNDSEMITLTQFSFPYYGRDRSEIRVSTNGYIYFGQEYNTQYNSPLPHTRGATGKIAVFWDDLHAGVNGTIYYQESATRLIVQYEAIAKDNKSGNHTFQVVLHANGEIEFFYKQLDGDTDESTVGIQNVSRNQGLQIAHNEPYLQNNLAIKFTTTKPLITVTPLAGAVSSKGNQLLNLSIDTENIIPDSYSGSITVSHTGLGTSPWTFPYDFEVPYAKLTQPTASSIFFEGEDLISFTNRLEAEVLDTPHDIDRVAFYAGNNYIGQSTYPSRGNVFYLSWYDLPAGEHSLYARVILDNAQSYDSSPVKITVLPDSNENHIDDTWEQANFSGQLVEASADADGDRYPNIFEYHHGSDPNDKDDFPKFELVQTNRSPIPKVGTVHFYQVDPALATETTYKKKTIQSALNAADDFDIIEVLAGTYNERIYLNDRVFLFGRDYASATTIDGTDQSASLVQISSESVIDGFTVQNGGSTRDALNGAGAYISIRGNQNKPRFVGCLFKDNKATNRGGAIYVSAGGLRLISCSLIDNQAPSGAAIYSGSNNSDIKLINTLLWNDAPRNGKEVQGSTNGGVYQNTLYRSSATGRVLIDGKDQKTTNPGITPYFGIYHNSPARDKGTASEFAKFDFYGEAREDGFTDIGVDELIDRDLDGIADTWMHFYGLTDPGGDADTDTLTNLQEYQYQTSPLSEDTDGDTLTDSDEIFTYQTDPLRSTDFRNIFSDLNGDGVLDFILVELGYDPQSDDWDGDGLSNQSEAVLGSNPFLSDSDGDGHNDRVDAHPLDPHLWIFGANDPSDTAAPVISILTPQGSQLVP